MDLYMNTYCLSRLKAESSLLRRLAGGLGRIIRGAPALPRALLLGLVRRRIPFWQILVIRMHEACTLPSSASFHQPIQVVEIDGLSEEVIHAAGLYVGVRS
jgi:hypothetical protein